MAAEMYTVFGRLIAGHRRLVSIQSSCVSHLTPPPPPPPPRDAHILYNPREHCIDEGRGEGWLLYFLFIENLSGIRSSEDPLGPMHIHIKSSRLSVASDRGHSTIERPSSLILPPQKNTYRCSLSCFAKDKSQVVAPLRLSHTRTHNCP